LRDHLTGSGVSATAIDFAGSWVEWQLAQPASVGRFAVDAALTVVDAAGRRDLFCLGAQVFAGEVYGQGALFRQPAYEFAAAFSATHFRIFRSPHGGREVDEHGAIAERFVAARRELKNARCRRIDGCAAALHPRQPLVARARLAGEGGTALELEFPVRHVNIDSQRDLFQVETGPLLALAPGAGACAAGLRRAYAIFSRLDAIELLLDDPAAGRRRWAERTRHACAIELLRLE